jgi:hypothetical protein
MNIVIRSPLPFDACRGRPPRSRRDGSPCRSRSCGRWTTFAETIAARPRFLAVLLMIAASLALALAAIGTYGILSYSVSQRRKETASIWRWAPRGSAWSVVLRSGHAARGVG